MKRSQAQYRPQLHTLESRRLLASVLYVDANAPGLAPDGASWDSAYNDLQLALAAAISGDEIRIAEGTYKPTSGIDRSAAFNLTTGVALRGGFAGAGAADPDANDIAAFPTILSGEIGASGITDNSYHVVVASGVDATARLEGVTITLGNSTTFGLNSGGGGMYISAGSPEFVNCTFTANRSASDGGAVFVTGDAAPTFSSCTFSDNSTTQIGGAVGYRNGAAVSITDSRFTQNHGYWGGAVGGYDAPTTMQLSGCSFISNTAQEGGAVWGQNASPQIRDCSFERNATTYLGGAMYVGGYLASPTIERCTFYANSAGLGNGGAVCIAASATPVVVNCLLVGNSAQTGGAIYFFGGSGTVVNNTLAQNSASSTGNAIHFNGSSASVANCIVSQSSTQPGQPITTAQFGGGSPAVTYSAVYGGYAGTGNTNADPLLLRSPSPGIDNTWGTPDDDFGDLRPRLSPFSPAVDGGDSAALPAGVSTDFAGNVRIINVPNKTGTGVDMGAYEYLAPLAMTKGAFVVDASKPTILFSFNGDLNLNSLASSDLVLKRLSDGSSIPGGSVAQASYDVARRTVSFALNPGLPDDNYTAALPPNSIADGANNPLLVAATFDFFLLAADGNRDRLVDTGDFNILAASFGESSRHFSQGNFNYDPLGVVDSADFNLLVTQFGKRLAPAAPALAKSPVMSVFATVQAKITQDMQDDFPILTY